MDAKVYGSDHQKCRFTDLPLETGHGALSVDAQAVANWGKLRYQLAELTQRRKDHADKQASELAKRNTMHAEHLALPADIVARQASVHRLANQDVIVMNCERQTAALAAAHEDLAVKIAEVGARLKEEGILDKHGMGPAMTWLGMIRDRGWAQ